MTRAGLATSWNHRPRDRAGGALQYGSARGTRAQVDPVDEDSRSEETHVLIAEDDKDMRRFLVESFEEEGFRVSEAENGEELRRRLSGSRRTDGAVIPDLLISDICLPVLSGLELLSELRRVDWSLPVILITAFGDESVHREGKRLGAAMVLDKPFDIEDLVRAVRGLVSADGDHAGDD